MFGVVPLVRRTHPLWLDTADVTAQLSDVAPFGAEPDSLAELQRLVFSQADARAPAIAAIPPDKLEFSWP